MEVVVSLYTGESLAIPAPTSTREIYTAVRKKLQSNFGLFDGFGKFYHENSALDNSITKYFVYKGEHGEVFFHLNGKKINQEPIWTFSREFGYPYKHRLLNQAALERMIMRSYPRKLLNRHGISVESVKIIDDTVDIYLSRNINIESSFRMVGAFRLINVNPSPEKKFIRGMGSFKVSAGDNVKLTSQILSTWGRQEEFSELDYEIRNYKHFQEMSKEINPKILEGFFIDNANETAMEGAVPDPFVLSLRFSEYTGGGKKFEMIKNFLANRPEPTRGRLEVYSTSFAWKSLVGKEAYHFPITPRIADLMARDIVNDGDVAKMIVRYESMGAAGQFTMTPRSVVRHLVEKHNIKYEGFGAPFNVDLPFCSLMFDVDIPFGSMGPFSYEQLLRRSGNWSINPPFTLKLLELALSSILKACEALPKDDDTQFHMLFPGWEDDPWMDILTGKVYSEFLVETIHMRLGEFSFERINGKPLYQPFGGLVYSVFSPMGKRHKTFKRQDIEAIKQEFQKTVPDAVRQNLFKVEHVPWQKLKEMKREEAAAVAAAEM